MRSKNKKNQVKLYNVMFPFWMIMALPSLLWMIIIPGNFAIDSLVLFVAMIAFKIENKKDAYKKYIWKIFGFGMLSDIIGSAFLFLSMICEIGIMGDEWYLTIPALVIASFFIFLFNYKFTFKDIEKKLRFKFALTFAIITAPYTFLVPSSWLYY